MSVIELSTINQPESTTRPLATRTAAEGFWYILMNIFGFAYLSKIPVKAALRDAGLVTMTGAENFWYVLLNILPPGGAYFAKVYVKKALSEVVVSK